MLHINPRATRYGWQCTPKNTPESSHSLRTRLRDGGGGVFYRTKISATAATTRFVFHFYEGGFRVQVETHSRGAGRQVQLPRDC